MADCKSPNANSTDRLDPSQPHVPPLSLNPCLGTFSFHRVDRLPAVLRPRCGKRFTIVGLSARAGFQLAARGAPSILTSWHGHAIGEVARVCEGGPNFWRPIGGFCKELCGCRISLRRYPLRPSYWGCSIFALSHQHLACDSRGASRGRLVALFWFRTRWAYHLPTRFEMIVCEAGLMSSDVRLCRCDYQHVSPQFCLTCHLLSLSRLKTSRLSSAIGFSGSIASFGLPTCEISTAFQALKGIWAEPGKKIWLLIVDG